MITIYSSHCPRCKMVENLLKNKNIKYSVVDDESIYLPLAEKNDIGEMPFAEINGKLYETKGIIECINKKCYI